MTLQTTKTAKIGKTYKVHAPKFQGRVFFWCRRSAAGMLIGHTKLKVTKLDKTQKIHAQKIQGCVFSEVAEAPQAR